MTTNRTALFGNGEHFSGRFTTTARSSSGSSLDLKVVVDAQGNIFLVAKQGMVVLGGFGTIALQANPLPSPSPTAAVAPERGGDDDPAGDDRRRHSGEDSDEAEDHHEDASGEAFYATFTVTLVNGQTVTGHLVGSHGLLLGDLTLNGVTYTFRAPQESAANRLANISTRGFVNTGQGQLIGGFIVRGGPKLVVIRALGPSLSAFGVNPALANPTLQLLQGQTVVRENDN